MVNNFIKLGHNITYNDKDLFNRYTIINLKEQEDFRNIIYKYDLICIFGLTDFLEEEINEKMFELYNMMIKNSDIENILTKLSTNYSINEEISFTLLFSYDNLHLFYPCICDFLENGAISIEKIDVLKKNLF
jgi:uncharacterized protein VirK/YbjX